MNHENCASGAICPLYKGQKVGVCRPDEDREDMRRWRRRREAGEPVGRAPQWGCPFYNE